MHELSLVESLREIIETEAIRQNYRKVRSVTLEIGTLSCVEIEALKFCFDEVMRGSPAEGATLIIATLDGRGHCRHCQQQHSMGELYCLCPDCQQPMEVVQGREIRLQSLDVCD